METLKTYVGILMQYAHLPRMSMEDKGRYRQTAFGAVEFFIMEHPNQSEEAEAYWEEVKDEFYE